MPKGGRETGTLLERCIKEFQDVSKYENDQRYLNVWLKYVSTKETYKFTPKLSPPLAVFPDCIE